MSTLHWIRLKLGITREQILTSFQKKHFAEFEQAIKESDVSAYIYELREGGLRGQTIILKDSDMHQVTPENLVSFWKLNRGHRRKLKSMTQHV